MTDEKELAMRARAKLQNEVVSGRIIRPTVCEKCGKACAEGKPWTIHGHHDDYTKPLDV